MVRTKQHVFFWVAHDENDGTQDHVFSQWYMRRFQDPSDGSEYSCAEQYMMAKKAQLFGDTETWTAIMSCDDPRKMKTLGREVANFDQAVWEAHRYDIVLQGNRLKFNTRDQYMVDALLSTADRVLVEASPYDRVWGIGLRPEEAAVARPGEWTGLNLLGQAITQVREEVRAQLGEQSA